MNTFTKYLLINILIIVPVVILTYWVTRPYGKTGSVSSTNKERFLADMDKVKRLYDQYKKSVETDDLGQRAQDKGDLEEQLSSMKSTYASTSPFGRIASIVDQNYKRLITFHIAASENKSEIMKRKVDLQNMIQPLEGENQNLNMRLTFLKSQPTLTPAP